jgi:hypothetical protein
VRRVDAERARAGVGSPRALINVNAVSPFSKSMIFVTWLRCSKRVMVPCASVARTRRLPPSTNRFSTWPSGLLIDTRFPSAYPSVVALFSASMTVSG